MASDTFSWSRGFNARWGHYAPHLLILSIGAVIALGFQGVPTSANLLMSLGLILFVVATWLMMRTHDRSLCEHCVASMPLNPSEQAKRYQRRFWMSHTGAERRFIIPYMVVLIGSNFFPGLPGRIAWAVIQTSMIYLILSYATHRRLQPWCPWCSEGGGGSEEIVVPDPIPQDGIKV